MPAADHVAIRGHQHALADGDSAGREHFAVEADVRAVGQLDVAVLARQDRVAPDEHAVADSNSAVGLALGVDQAVVVDDDVAPDVDLVRMAQHDVLSEDDVAPARTQQQRIQPLAQHEPERARSRLRGRHDELVLQQRPEPRTADDQRSVLRGGGAPGIEELLLRFRDRRHIWQTAIRDRRSAIGVLRSSHVHGTSPGSGGCLRAIRRAARTRFPAARA